MPNFSYKVQQTPTVDPIPQCEATDLSMRIANFARPLLPGETTELQVTGVWVHVNKRTYLFIHVEWQISVSLI